MPLDIFILPVAFLGIIILLAPILMGLFLFVGDLILFIHYLSFRSPNIYLWAKRNNCKYAFRKYVKPEGNIVSGKYKGRDLLIYDESWGTLTAGRPRNIFFEKIRLYLGIGKEIRKSPFVTHIQIDDKKTRIHSSDTFLGFYMFPSWDKEVIKILDKITV